MPGAKANTSIHSSYLVQSTADSDSAIGRETLIVGDGHLRHDRWFSLSDKRFSNSPCVVIHLADRVIWRRRLGQKPGPADFHFCFGASVSAFLHRLSVLAFLLQCFSLGVSVSAFPFRHFRFGVSVSAVLFQRFCYGVSVLAFLFRHFCYGVSVSVFLLRRFCVGVSPSVFLFRRFYFGISVSVCFFYGILFRYFCSMFLFRCFCFV